MREYLNKLFEIDEEIEINKNSEREASIKRRQEELEKYRKRKKEREEKRVSERRNHIVALFMALLFGLIGIHQFYLGKIGQGLSKIALLIAAVIFSFTGYNYYYLVSDPSLLTIGVTLFSVAVVWWGIDIYRISYNKIMDINNRSLKGEIHRNNIFWHILLYFLVYLECIQCILIKQRQQ